MRQKALKGSGKLKSCYAAIVVVIATGSRESYRKKVWNTRSGGENFQVQLADHDGLLKTVKSEFLREA